jgi:MYXO-CTERM domain-containing protein
MCKAQMTTGCPWLVGLVLFWNSAGAQAQAPQYWDPDGHDGNTHVAWGPNGHGNNEHSVPGLNWLGTLGDPGVEATSGPTAHGANERPMLGLNGLDTEDGVAGEAVWSQGAFAHLLAVPGVRSVAPDAKGSLMPDASDLLPPHPVMAPLSGAPRAGGVPSPGAAALIALAALGTRRRRRRG